MDAGFSRQHLQPGAPMGDADGISGDAGEATGIFHGHVFEDEESMQNALSEEEFYMAQMIRNLKKLSDIYAVLNEEKYLDTFSRIGDIYLKSVEK